jgi:hypothetical protein
LLSALLAAWGLVSGAAWPVVVGVSALLVSISLLVERIFLRWSRNAGEAEHATARSRG